MKRIKAVNGYTIYQATARDEEKRNVESGYFYLYFSSDIRDYGINYCDPDYEAGSLEEAISFATGTNYAIAKEYVEESTTAATYEEIVEIEKQLDAGATLEDIDAARDEETTANAAQYEEVKIMGKKPTARINSINAIRKACDNSGAYNAAHAGQDPATIKIHISAGNTKLGSIMNISIPPVVTCHNCSSCSKYCYAIRSYNRFTGTAAGWNENYLLFLTDPVHYFNEISKAVKTQRFFRWHVSGDIVNECYLFGMIAIARENPKCEFLAFTKAYQVVNRVIAAGYATGHGYNIPENLHILFSAAPGVEMPNPYRLPECHINFADPALNTYCGGAEYEYHCTGNCTECAVNCCGCFFLKPGDVTIIDQH